MARHVPELFRRDCEVENIPSYPSYDGVGASGSFSLSEKLGFSVAILSLGGFRFVSVPKVR